MKANPEIFKAYDIRGEWQVDWDEQFAYKIGLALAEHFKPKIVAIGYDMRESSPIIFEKLSQAFIEKGIFVYDLGLCSTELTYFASSYILGIDLSLMITASHNPGKDNGIKVTLPKAVSVGLDNGLKEVRELASKLILPSNNDNIGNSNNLNSKGEEIRKYSLWKKYREHILNLAQVDDLSDLKKMRIVVDPGNGVGGHMIDKVFPDLNIVKICWEPDGSFPNHPSDPFIEENVADLKKKVVEEKAVMGISLDGDSDRIFFIDETGRYIPAYYFTALMIEYFLKNKEPGKNSTETIVYDPRYYWATIDNTFKHGAKITPSKVGHTFIKSVMRKHQSIFSGECSGHIFYQSNNYAESTMLTMLFTMKLMKEKGKLSSLVNKYFKQYPISGEINFKLVEEGSAVIKRIKEYYQEEGEQHSNSKKDSLFKGKIVEFDGIEVSFPEWRCNVRTSNTQSLLRLNVEAKTKKLVRQKVEELTLLINEKEEGLLALLSMNTDIYNRSVLNLKL